MKSTTPSHQLNPPGAIIARQPSFPWSLPLAVAALQTGISERRAALIPAWRSLKGVLAGPRALAEARARLRSDWFLSRRLEKALDWPLHSLPTVDGRAGAGDFLLLLVDLVRQHRPETVVEFGSGISTLVLARALQMNGAGQLISFEHKQGFAELARHRLAARGLPGTVRAVPLIPSDAWGYAGSWYKSEGVPKTIDLLIIDGPPAYLAPETRGGAGPALFSRLSPGGLIVLDDAKRRGEQTIARRWRREFTDFGFVEIETRKGTLIGFRQGRADGGPSRLFSDRWKAVAAR